MRLTIAAARTSRRRYTCPACNGSGGQPVTVYHGGGPNDCSPDFDECGACGGPGHLPTRAEANAIAEEVADAAIAEEMMIEAAAEAEREYAGGW